MIDKNRIETFCKKALIKLKGDWVLLGGSLLGLLNISKRQTLDIDIISISPSDSNETLKLMKIADDMKIPPEAINQAAAFYLRNLDGWQDRLVLLKQSKLCKIYRPDASLYILLKLKRNSQTDQEDIKVMISFAHEQQEPIDFKWISSLLNKEETLKCSKSLDLLKIQDD